MAQIKWEWHTHLDSILIRHGWPPSMDLKSHRLFQRSSVANISSPGRSYLEIDGSFGMFSISWYLSRLPFSLLSNCNY